MTREIKFRAKTINGEFVFGNYSHLKKDYSTIRKGYYISNSAGAPFAFMVRPETLSQFTGLKDKNGKEIYEGDIVKVSGKPYESTLPIVVVFGKKSHGWSLKFNCGNHYEKKPMIKYYSLPVSKNIEVIGNIY